MSKIQIRLICMVLLFLPCMTRGQKAISYGDYNIETKFPIGDSRPYFTIKNSGRLLAKHSGLIASDIGMKIELVELLQTQNKQLLVRMYTGGNHCCDIIRIYDLGPRLKLLFKSSDYDLANREGLRNFEAKQLDDDAPMELIAESYAFAYFDNLPWVSCPMPTLIFDFDIETKSFRLANREFSKYLLADVDRRAEQSRSYRTSNPVQFAVSMFSVYADMVYAGKFEEANRFYFGDGDLKHLELQHARLKVMDALQGDKSFRRLFRQ